MTSRRPTTAATVPVLVLGLLLVLGACTTSPRPRGVQPGSEPGAFVGGTPVPHPYLMPDQPLTDTGGRAYNLSTSPSKPVTLLFFGYTHCPDVCVTVLSDVALALKQLDDGHRAQVQLVFVTTDPARDTGPVVRRYLDRFDPTFVGLTGDLASIKRVAGRVGVQIEGRARLPGGGYELGHSAQVIGFQNGRGVVMWVPGTPITHLRTDIATLVDQAG